VSVSEADGVDDRLTRKSIDSFSSYRIVLADSETPTTHP
jgi:hypothetical protein